MHKQNILVVKAALNRNEGRLCQSSSRPLSFVESFPVELLCESKWSLFNPTNVICCHPSGTLQSQLWLCLVTDACWHFTENRENLSKPKIFLTKRTFSAFWFMNDAWISLVCRLATRRTRKAASFLHFNEYSVSSFQRTFINVCITNILQGAHIPRRRVRISLANVSFAASFISEQHFLSPRSLHRRVRSESFPLTSHRLAFANISANLICRGSKKDELGLAYLCSASCDCTSRFELSTLETFSITFQWLWCLLGQVRRSATFTTV